MGALGGRPTRWWAGWRLVIRIARRDARRHKGRTALVVVMVGLPVVLLATGATLLATNDVTPLEAVPRTMGAAQARLTDIGNGQPVAQGANPDVETILDGRARSVPGHVSGTPWTAAQLEQVTGRQVLAVTESQLLVRIGDRRVSTRALGVDGREPVAGPMVRLVSGRWPSSPSEVLVTEASIARGFPRGGTLVGTSLDRPGGGPTLTVVGVGDGVLAHGGRPDVIGLPQLAASDAWRSWLVKGSGPVTWPEVQRLNGFGLAVTSRQVLAHPPAPAQVSPRAPRTGSGSDLTTVVLLAAVGIFVETALLAGPAFAVTSARQRRTIALFAGNGAERAQLRRYVLALALVLGVVTAVAAGLAGLAAAAALLRVWEATHPAFDTGPFEVPAWTLLGILACAVGAALVAAAVPARGASRLDLVQVLRGRVAPLPPRRGLPTVGVVLATASTALILLAASGRLPLDTSSNLVAIAGGAIALVLGALMTIPATMGLLGLLGAHLPLPVRLATRDSSRQRGRSAPTVAAIMAAVAALTAVSIGAASRAARNDADYVPQLPMGVGRVFAGSEPGALRAVASVVHAQAPSLLARPVGQLVPPEDAVRPGAAAPVTLPVLGAVHPGCSDQQAFVAFVGGAGSVPGCEAPGAGVSGRRSQVAVMDEETAGRLLPLTAQERRTLHDGGVLVADAGLLDQDHVTFAAGRAPVSPNAPGSAAVEVRQRWDVPAAAVDAAAWRAGFPDWQVGAVLTPAAAAAHGWAVGDRTTYLFSPGGSVTEAQQETIAEHLDGSALLVVERGFQDDQRTLLLVVFAIAGLLVLVATLVATALSLAEGQADMATLAAVGATRHTRRAVAGSQALLVGLVGCALGLVVGAIPGVALTWPLTAHRLDDLGHLVPTHPTLVVPWAALGGLAVGVPLVAAILAAGGVRRGPTVTRRMT